jgi:hypothetical protein
MQVGQCIHTVRTLGESEFIWQNLSGQPYRDMNVVGPILQFTGWTIPTSFRDEEVDWIRT